MQKIKIKMDEYAKNKQRNKYINIQKINKQSNK